MVRKIDGILAITWTFLLKIIWKEYA